MIKFLFLDNWTLEYVRGFRRTVHEAKKHPANPLLVPGTPWEGNRVLLYGTVLRDSQDGLFRMWYGTTQRDDDLKISLCLATSRDGIRWKKPKLGVYRHEGKDTNVVLPPDRPKEGVAIVEDLHCRKSGYRYKFLTRASQTLGVLAYGSRDGIHWRKLQKDWVIPIAADCHIGCYQDAKTGRFTAYLRPVFGDRRVACCESEDFIHWTRPALCLEPDHYDSSQLQFYGMQATPYGDYVIGMLNAFRTVESDMRWNKSSGTLDMELAYSRGGRLWHRAAPNEPILPMAGMKEWDGVMTTPSSALVYLDDEIRLYYAGCPYSHDGDFTSAPECIGMASWRVDGFVSLDAGAREASLLTRPFALKQPEILVNADAQGGDMRVEMQAADGTELPGFELSSCLPIRGDSTAHRVQWKGHVDLSALRKKPIRMKVEARKASLYSIWFPNGDKHPKYNEFREIACVNPTKDLQEPDERKYP